VGKTLFITIVLASLIVGLFSWGFLVGKKRVFPFKLIRSISEQVGLAPKGLQDHESVTSGAIDASALVALPYLQATFDPNADLEGVVHHEKERTLQGLNLYSSVSENEAHLIDMSGRRVKTWTHPGLRWQFVTLTADGGLLALSPHDRLLKLDGGSNLVWEYPADVHHVAATDREGRIYVLSQEERSIPSVHPTRSSIVDIIDVLTPEGELIESVSLLDVLQRSAYEFLLPSVPYLETEDDQALDILHTNHIEIFDGSLAEKSPLFAEGNALISIRNLNAIAILEKETWDILWLWGPSNMTQQHHPTLLENGHVLIFNNGLSASSIVEMDPLTGAIEWRYAAEGFFSKTRGSNQRLPNGNTLITDSDRGYAFEIAPNDDIVWHFANPDVSRGKRSAIFRMTRYAPDAPEIAALMGR